MTVPAPITSEWDNRRAEEAIQRALGRLSGYPRALARYALDVIGNVPIGHGDAVAADRKRGALGRGDPADLLRLARELLLGVQALQAGVAQYEQAAVRDAPAPQTGPAGARQAPSPDRAVAQKADLAGPNNRQDLLSVAAQAGVVQRTAQRAAKDLAGRPARQHGALRQLLAALGMALIRAGLWLKDTHGSTPAGLARQELDPKIAKVLNGKLDDLNRQLTDLTTRLQAQRQRLGLPTTVPAMPAGTAVDTGIDRMTGAGTVAPAEVTGQQATTQAAMPGPQPGSVAALGAVSGQAGARMAGEALPEASRAGSDALLEHLAQVGGDPYPGNLVDPDPDPDHGPGNAGGLDGVA